MTTGLLRLSPSGPFLTNDNGGIFKPGPGASLRLVEAASTLGGGGLAVIPTTPIQLSSALGGDFGVALTAPAVGKNYRADVRCDVDSASTNVTAVVELYLDTSVDGGATWTNQSSNSHKVSPNTTTGTARQISLSMTLRSGGSLSVTGDPATASLKVRARIGASAGGGTATVIGGNTPGSTPGSAGNIHLALEECF